MDDTLQNELAVEPEIKLTDCQERPLAEGDEIRVGLGRTPPRAGYRGTILTIEPSTPPQVTLRLQRESQPLTIPCTNGNNFCRLDLD